MDNRDDVHRCRPLTFRCRRRCCCLITTTSRWRRRRIVITSKQRVIVISTSTSSSRWWHFHDDTLVVDNAVNATTKTSTTTSSSTSLLRRRHSAIHVDLATMGRHHVRSLHFVDVAFTTTSTSLQWRRQWRRSLDINIVMTSLLGRCRLLSSVVVTWRVLAHRRHGRSPSSEVLRRRHPSQNQSSSVRCRIVDVSTSSSWRWRRLSYRRCRANHVVDTAVTATTTSTITPWSRLSLRCCRVIVSKLSSWRRYNIVDSRPLSSLRDVSRRRQQTSSDVVVVLCRSRNQSSLPRHVSLTTLCPGIPSCFGMTHVILLFCKWQMPSKKLKYCNNGNKNTNFVW